jgi:hypothetical protein
MHLLALGWLYVVATMAVVEGASPSGSVLGAIFTFALYGLLPLSIALYLWNTPARRSARRRREAAARARASAAQPDQRGHAPGGAVAPEREEP